MDVAKALGYTNTRKALAKHVEKDDKTTVAIRDTGSAYKSKAKMINENGLYSLILSLKPRPSRLQRGLPPQRAAQHPQSANQPPERQTLKEAAVGQGRGDSLGQCLKNTKAF